MRLRLLLAIACGALLLAAPVAHAARGMEVAISDEDAMVTGQTGNPLVAYQAAQALNATRMRILVQWSRVSDADDQTPSPTPTTTGARSTMPSTPRRCTACAHSSP